MKFRRRRLKEVGVDLTPLIDVVFLLLIFFMVSTSFTKETQLTIDLPEATGQPRQTEIREIEVLIDEGGTLRVNGSVLADTQPRTLQAAIYQVSGGDTTLPLIISADADTSHQAVVSAMDAAGQMGFVHLTITTQQPSGS